MDVCLLYFRRGALHEENMMVRVCLAEIEVHENEDVNIGELGMI